jgi:hypothetical protein
MFIFDGESSYLLGCMLMLMQELAAATGYKKVLTLFIIKLDQS